MAERSPWAQRKEAAKLAIRRCDETGSAGCALPAGIAVGALVTFVSEQVLLLLQDQNESKYAKFSLGVCAVATGVLVRQALMYVLARHHMESLMKSHPVVFEQALAEVSESIQAATRESVLEALRKNKALKNERRWKE